MTYSVIPSKANPDNVTIELNGSEELSVKNGGITEPKLSFEVGSVKIADVTLSAATTNIDLTGLDINTDGDYVLYLNAALSPVTYIGIYANADYVSANYLMATLTAGSSTSTAMAGGSTITESTTAALDDYSTTLIYISRKKNGKLQFTVRTSQYLSGTGRIRLRDIATVGAHANITELRLSSSKVDGFLTDTNIKLYKI